MPHTRTLRRIPHLAALVVLAVLLGLAVSRGTAQRRQRHASPTGVDACSRSRSAGSVGA